ncbi:MAG: PIN domain-containing protein [Acidobacteria bacterium]|nr:MAG: PIN domain-containing protein [Acidobacteriota bacterium]
MAFLYLDSSVVLRYVYRQPGFLELAKRRETVVASPLTGVECLRSLDRIRLEQPPQPSWQTRRALLSLVLDHVQEIDLTRAILTRAGGPLAVPLKALDAIHLASALFWHELHGGLGFATHDRALARAARLYGLQVVGITD